MIKKNYPYVLAVIFIGAAWYILSIILKLPIIPSPIDVFINLYSIFLSKIAGHALYSLFRIFSGIILSVVIGIPIGLSMGYFKKVDKVLSPVIYFIYPIPKIALLPVIMLLFGLGEFSKVVMIFLIVVFQIIVTSRDAVKDIPKETYYSLYSLGASRVKIFKNIVIPAALPGLISSIRIGLGTAVSVLFFTETFGTEYGMGYFIMDAWMRVNYIEMYSGIIVLSIIGFGLFYIVDMLEKRICSWK
jgi:NitT/TauT family transport system permease protein